MQPAAREVERVACPEGQLQHGRSGLAERGRPALRLQRQLQQRFVHPPVLLAGDLEHEDVVGVVVDGEPLRAAGRVVRVRLDAAAQLLLERPAEPGERRPRVVERLEDDRRAVGERRRHAVRVGDAQERFRPPRDVGRVRRLGDRAALLDQPEARRAETA